MTETECFKCRGRGFISHALDACPRCGGTGIHRRRCTQCWQWKEGKQFLGARGAVKACKECRGKYKNWDQKSLDEKLAASDPRKGLAAGAGKVRVFFTQRSGNRKTGPIPVSMTSANTCPPSCSYYGKGCYAESHILGIHWRRLSRGEGLTWDAFCDKVRALPKGQLWRHNEAGDLPGIGEELNEHRMIELVGAAQHTKGFTYTHKREGFELMRYATANGLVVNLSVDSLDEVDKMAEHGLPMTTVLPHDVRKSGFYTAKGTYVVICPAQLHDDISCMTCRLCSVGARKSVVGFLAHGQRKAMMSEAIERKSRRQLPLFKEK